MMCKLLAVFSARTHGWSDNPLRACAVFVCWAPLWKHQLSMFEKMSLSKGSSTSFSAPLLHRNVYKGFKLKRLSNCILVRHNRTWLSWGECSNPSPWKANCFNRKHMFYSSWIVLVWLREWVQLAVNGISTICCQHWSTRLQPSS